MKCCSFQRILATSVLLVAILITSSCTTISGTNNRLSESHKIAVVYPYEDGIQFFSMGMMIFSKKEYTVDDNYGIKALVEETGVNALKKNGFNAVSASTAGLVFHQLRYRSEYFSPTSEEVAKMRECGVDMLIVIRQSGTDYTPAIEGFYQRRTLGIKQTFMLSAIQFDFFDGQGNDVSPLPVLSYMGLKAIDPDGFPKSRQEALTYLKNGKLDEIKASLVNGISTTLACLKKHEPSNKTEK
jgi:hypothetical protein